MNRPYVKATGTKKAPSLVNLKDEGLPTTISLIKRSIKPANQGCKRLPDLSLPVRHHVGEL